MHHYTLKSERQSHSAAGIRLRTCLAYGLSILLIWQPVLLAAEPISPTHETTGRPTLDQAANGVPVINIQNPNSSGVSQNFYHDFNVDNRGVIFNNSKQMTQTQLGGYIEGNPNLRGGTARLILNEVIGTDPSLLNGYMEVGGRRADVVLANPNGITCNGCGFINTSHATLTTGTPIMDGGALQGFNVQGGQIEVGEDGLNGANTERFDLIARSVRLAGALHASELNVVTGKQQVDRQTLAITNAGTDGDSPIFAIDSSALGGMYANRIRLIANEGGVGVRLDAPVAAQSGDLALSANGLIQYTDMAATGDISITAHNSDVVGAGTVQGLSDITINADSYDNSGAVVAEGVAAVRADQVSNSGTLGGREALRITADVINNDEGGALLSGGDITLEANEVTNRLADIYAVGDIDITARDGGEAEQLENRSGRIEARGDLTIKAQEIWNVRDFLEWQEVMTGGNAVYECIECRRSRFSMRYIFTEQFHRELDEKTTGRSLLISGSDMALVGDSIVNETSDILSFGDIDLDVGRVDNLGLHSGDYEIVNRYVQEIRSWIHVGLVENGIQPYNTRNYYGGTEYWGGGKNKALEYMRLLPDAVNSNYDPDNLLAREDNLIHKNLYHAGEQLKILESTNILGANIISGGNLDMNEAALYNGDVGHREQDNFTEEELIAVRDSTGNAGSYDDYLVGVNGGLFSVADPEHPYLIETNPFFATADGLLGSEYLLNRLDWDPDGAMRLLGDGYYEQQLVREQIIELTGRVFLSDQYADANAQYKALLDNGAFAAESLELAVGVALTADQVNRLTKDIVWMVEKEVAGETVLVPQVFLAPNSKVIESSGTLVASGGDMFINDGSILNTGTVHFGGNAIFTLDEAGLQNLGGDITGDGALIVESEGEIRNVSGTISAREVALRSATEINNLRFHRLNELSAGGTREWDTDTGRAGVISGSESLSLDSAGDINIVGSKLDGGEIFLDADGNIVIGTVEVKEGREGSYHGGYLSESSVRHLGSEINATLGLIANAANDLSLIGSDLNSDGDVQISASNDVRIASVENSSSYNFLVRHDGETSHNIKRNVQQRGATISGKGNVTIESGNNLTTIASNLLADGDLSLMAKGDLSLLSASNAEYRYSYSEDDGSFGRSRTVTTESDRRDVVGTVMNAGGKLSLVSETGDVHLAASQGHGEKGVEVDAGGDIRVESGVNSTYSRVQTTNTNAARIKTRDTGSVRQTLAQAGLSSGEGMSLNAEGDVVLSAAELTAKADLRIGEATVAVDKAGAMKLDEDGNPVIERGSIDNLYIGTVALENQSWDEKTRSLRGPVKELAKVASAAIGMGGLIMPELAVVGSGSEIVLSEKQGERMRTVTEVGSQLTGQDVVLVAQENIVLTGAEVAADEAEGSVVALADRILLDTAVTDTTHTQVNQQESAAGIKPSVSKDEVSLGGVAITDHKATTNTRTVTHTGTSISGNQIMLKADSALTLINADITATGDGGSLTLDSSEITVTGIQDTKQVNHAEETEVTTLTAGVRNAYVDTVYAVKAVEEAGEEVDRARRALSDAERAYDRGEISAGALDDYKGMLAMATANFAQAELAATQALATAGAAVGSSAGTGFYVSGNAQVTETRTEQNDSIATWQGSTLTAANMSINADVASIIGSEVNAGALALDAGSILLGAGTNTQSSSFEQQSRNASVGASSSGAGSWNASVGYNEASSSSEATQHVNTRFNVGHLSSTSDNMTLRGAVVMADTADITTGKLTIESLQDTHKSENNSKGINVGIGAGTDSIGKPQSGSGGVNFAKGDAESAITGEQTALLIADGANSQVTAEHTFLKGGMIANASWERPEGADEGATPVLVDHGQLNFTTGTLTVEDLRDYSRSSQTGGGIQTNFGLSRYSGDSPEHYETYTTESGEQGTRGKQYPTGATTISLQSEGRRMEGATLATIGGGNVVVGGVALDEHEDFAGLNRDIDKGQIVTVDQQTGALNGSFSVDHRLLSGTGRQVIADQHVDLGDNFRATVGGIAGDLSRTGTVLGGVILEAGQIGAGLAHIDGNQGVAYAEEGRLAGDIEGIRDGGVEDAVYAQQALNSIDGYFQGATDGEAGQRVKVTDGAFNPDGNSVAGAANYSTDTMYIDLADQHRNSLMRTFTEESMHLAGAGDPMAGFVGWLGDLTYRANAWANSSNISHYHAVVPVQNWAVHQNLLGQNLAGFATDAVNNDLLYRQLNQAELAAVFSPESQDIYRRIQMHFGVEPSPSPALDLYVAAIASVDSQAAELLNPTRLASRTIQHLADKSAELGENYRNESGSSGSLFQVSEDDYFNSRINSYAFYGDESVNDSRVKWALLSGWNEYGQHDWLSAGYFPAMQLGNQQAGDALVEQNLELMKMLGLSMIAGGYAIKALETGGKLIFMGGATSAGAGYYNDGISGALTATSGYVQTVGGVEACVSLVGCSVGAPVIADGFNKLYRGTWTTSNTKEEESSLYAIGSNRIFGTPMPGQILDYSTDAFSLLRAPHTLLNPEKNNLYFDIPFLVNDGLGVWGQLNSGQMKISGSVGGE